MLEVLREFEQGATRFSPLVLILPGVIAVVIGLFVWLGGLGFRRILAGLVGAIIGVSFGFFVAGRNLVWAASSVVIGAVIAIIFQRVFFAILIAALAAAIGFVVLAGPYIKQIESTTPPSWDTAPMQSETLNNRESIKMIKVYATDVGERIKQSYNLIPLHKWVIIATIFVAFLMIGLLLRRICSALSCATLGTMLIFAGMVLVLLYKGSAPISRISTKSSFYGLVFLAMVAFGTVEQLVLFVHAKRQLVKRKKQEATEQVKAEHERQSWRTT
jgi:hypothetical protein